MLSRLNTWAKPGEAQPCDAPVQALPASWYRSEAMYELERRAIFSKNWIVITHTTRFKKAGDFVQVKEAGFAFLIMKDRQGIIRAHHNVCRHRAYPLVEQESGHVNIFSCKYHGWSYGLDGRLAKAPKYDELSTFDKGSNGLFGIHVHVDRLGFAWINLDSQATPGIAWRDDFKGVDEEPRLQPFDLSQYHLDHEWHMIGDFNWKTLADNYNECYHCPTGHPALNAVSDFAPYRVETKGGHIQHFNVDRGEEEDSKLAIFSSFYYPNSSITVSPHFFYIQRCVPMSARQTRMEYEVYRHNDAKDRDFDRINNIFKQVLKEDKELCNAAQKNLNAGVFDSGELHPRVEKGPLFFQQLTKKLVMEHRKAEEAAREEIWPARPQQSFKNTVTHEEDIRFCARLDCSSSKDDLSW